MKKTAFKSFLIVWAAAVLQSCGGGDAGKKDGAEEPKQETTSTTKEDASSEKKGMSIAEAKAFLEADPANKGKEVTVSGYSWGSNDRMGGEVQLNLGDKKLEGMQQASFSCIFTKEQATAAKALAKDALVTVSGKIAKGAGGVEMTDCKIMSDN